jgi:hypothetical protein
MKSKLISIITAGALIASCGSYNPIIDTGITTGISVALSLIPPQDQKPIANYFYNYSNAVHTITATDPPPTPEQLLATLNGFVPPAEFTKYPALRGIPPLIVQGYTVLLAQYGANAAKLYQAINKLANDIQLGASQYK